MKKMSAALGVLALFHMISPASAADVEAGKSLLQPCTVCHGANGVSVSGDIPNLAGQKTEYLVTQLKAFRAGKRSNEMMNAIASQLSDADIDNVTAYIKTIGAAPESVASETAADVNKTNVKFPADYKKNYKQYMSINFADKKQVRHYLANEVAFKAAREGKPMPNGAAFLVEVYAAKLDADKKPVMGADGFFEPEKLVLYTAMQMEDGWGKDIPALYRNGDWNYALITTGGAIKPDTNQAKCFACHKPLDKVSYLFTLKELTAKAKE